MLGKRIMNHPLRSNRGFSMIELLVAVLVLAIGLLGVAGVQLLSMQQTSNSNMRSQATLAAQDVAERVRANAGGAIGGEELASLQARLQRDLGPGSQVQVQINGETAQISIQWDERGSFAADENATQTFTMRARL